MSSDGVGQAFTDALMAPMPEAGSLPLDKIDARRRVWSWMREIHRGVETWGYGCVDDFGSVLSLAELRRQHGPLSTIVPEETEAAEMPTGDDFVTRFSTPSLIEERGNL